MAAFGSSRSLAAIAALAYAVVLHLWACEADPPFEPSSVPAGRGSLAPASDYEILDLGTLGGTYAEGRGVNDQGHVVGYSRTPTGLRAPFLFDGQTMIQLPMLGREAVANAIDGSGRVVGWSFPGICCQSRATVWEDGAIAELGILGQASEATDINEQGQIVGWYRPFGGGAVHAFLWDNGVFTDLGTMGGLWSEAHGINEAGHVVGRFGALDGVHGFLWHSGAVTDLGVIGFSFSDAVAADLNDSRQVVGHSRFGSRFGAFLWDQGSLTDLETLGGLHAQAFAIDDRGRIVGYAWNTDFPNPVRAAIWEDGTVSDLGSLSGSSVAKGISKAGHIVGASSPGRIGSTVVMHAVMWKRCLLTAELLLHPHRPAVAADRYSLSSGRPLIVAVLSEENLDAAAIDVEGVLLGDPRLSGRVAPVSAHLADPNGDGLLDLVLDFGPVRGLTAALAMDTDTDTLELTATAERCTIRGSAAFQAVGR